MNEFRQLFYEKIELIPFHSCWEWIGDRSNVYGRIAINKIRYPAHRLSWMIHYGAIENDKEVCHKCDNPTCVRPDHLFLGTHAENMQDMVRKNRRRSPFGIRHGNSILSDKQIIEIRASDLTRRELSILYGVTEQNIKSILTKRTWKHL